MTESPKLLPCPFCGGTDIRQSIATDAIYTGTRLYCAECSSSVVYWGGPAFLSRATALWNRRALDPEREAMARVCEAAAAIEMRGEPAMSGEYHKGSYRLAYMQADRLEALAVALADLERARKGEG